MRQNPNSRRSRGRGGRKPGSPRSQIFDSNGPGARVRGNSSQIYEKYQQLARDASSSGDRIAAENFYQHAEHYYRLMEAAGLNRNGNSQDEAQQRTDGSAKNGEPVAAANPASGQASDGDAAVVIEAAATESSDKQDDASPDSTNGSGDGEGKPARRSRGRRSNGAANGGSAQDNDTEAASSDDGSEPLSEDTGPASA